MTNSNDGELRYRMERLVCAADDLEASAEEAWSVLAGVLPPSADPGSAIAAVQMGMAGPSVEDTARAADAMRALAAMIAAAQPCESGPDAANPQS